MKTTALSFSARIRLALLNGMARLIAKALAPTLRPVPLHARSGRVIDGEFKRIHHNDRW